MQYFTSALVIAFATIVGSQTIDPNSVPLSTRSSWCTNQQYSCPFLCTQQTNSATTYSNTCDPKTLQWSCVCVDGLTPSVANYSLTVPFYECQEFGNQCVANCGSSSSCASACRTNYPCGAQNPTRINVTSTTSSTSTAAATGTSSSGSDGTFGGAASNGGSTGTSSNSASTTTRASAATAIDVGRSYGVVVLAGIIFAGFGLAL